MKYHIKIIEFHDGDLKDVYDEKGKLISHKDISIPINPTHKFTSDKNAIDWFIGYSTNILDDISHLKDKECHVCLYTDDDDRLFEIRKNEPEKS